GGTTGVCGNYRYTAKHCFDDHTPKGLGGGRSMHDDITEWQQVFNIGPLTSEQDSTGDAKIRSKGSDLVVVGPIVLEQWTTDDKRRDVGQAHHCSNEHVLPLPPRDPAEQSDYPG